MLIDPNKTYLEGLTHKQQLFVEYYDGNALGTAKKAGYQGNNNVLGQIGHKLVNNGKIIEAIRQRDAANQQTDSNIISREDIEIELSSIVRDSDAKPETRIKAMERLAKMRGYDKETVEVHGVIANLTDRQVERRLADAMHVIGVAAPGVPLLTDKHDD